MITKKESIERITRIMSQHQLSANPGDRSEDINISIANYIYSHREEFGLFIEEDIKKT